MRLPTSIVSVGLAFTNQTFDNTVPKAHGGSQLPTPTIGEKWTTAFPYHTPTADLIMVPYMDSDCEEEKLQADLLQEGMIGLGVCYPVSNSGSFLWYGQIDCAVTLHSGVDCGGWEWQPEMGVCYNQQFGSFRAYC